MCVLPAGRPARAAGRAGSEIRHGTDTSFRMHNNKEISPVVSALFRRAHSAAVSPEPTQRAGNPAGVVAFWAFAAFFAPSSLAQTWTALTHQPSFTPEVALLLTDGTVMVCGFHGMSGHHST